MHWTRPNFEWITLKLVGIPQRRRHINKTLGRMIVRMESNKNARDIVLAYIRALDNQDYSAAQGYLDDGVRIKGPAEEFNKPKEFIDMMRQYRGKYDVKKVFVDGDDVCVLYNFATPTTAAFMCSWYQVKDGRIGSIQTVFNPRAFGPPPGMKGG